MTPVQITKYKCDICGHLYGTAGAATRCESEPIKGDKGVKVGDYVTVTRGEGVGEIAKVTNVFVFSADWGPRQYHHSIGINADLISSYGSRQLTFDSYETTK